MPDRAMRLGIPPRLVLWQWRKRETLFAYVKRKSPREASIEILQERHRESYPLPRNILPEDLCPHGALWGYSIADVPSYEVGETYIAKLKNMRFVFAQTPDKKDFFPALIGPEDQSIEAREISYRPIHGPMSRADTEPQRLRKATWILERAYHNHSHWLTAHLPKLLLLKERGALDGLVLPQRRTKVMDQSMRMIGIEPEEYTTVSFDTPLAVEELCLVGTDRFAPDHMRAVRDAFTDSSEATRKILISRENSRGRKLTNEDQLWPVLQAAGFEKVLMEDLDFGEQVELMAQTKIVVAPHGAGLTNMIFCPEGSHVVEIGDPQFPNPNFYALSSALGLHYWLLHASASKAPHPLDRDLTVDIASVERILRQIV